MNTTARRYTAHQVESLSELKKYAAMGFELKEGTFSIGGLGDSFVSENQGLIVLSIGLSKTSVTLPFRVI